MARTGKLGASWVVEFVIWHVLASQTFFAVLNFRSSNHFIRRTQTRFASNTGNYPKDIFLNIYSRHILNAVSAFILRYSKNIIAFAGDEQVSLITADAREVNAVKIKLQKCLQSLYSVRWTLNRYCFTTHRGCEVLFWSLRNNPTCLIILIITAVGTWLRKLLNNAGIAPIQESMEIDAYN